MQLLFKVENSLKHELDLTRTQQSSDPGTKDAHFVLEGENGSVKIESGLEHFAYEVRRPHEASISHDNRAGKIVCEGKFVRSVGDTSVQLSRAIDVIVEAMS